MQVERDSVPGSGNLVAHVQHHLHRAYNYTLQSISSAFYGAGFGGEHRVLAQHKAGPQHHVEVAAHSSSDKPHSTHRREATTSTSSSATCTAVDRSASLVASLPRTALLEDKSWRCDLHPAWSRDFHWVAINGRPQGAERQVLLVHIGPDPAAFFP